MPITSLTCTSRQARTQAPQAMHSYCRPLRMSMPVGQTCTQMVQSMQSPSSSGANFGSGATSARSPSQVIVPWAWAAWVAADGWRPARNT